MKKIYSILMAMLGLFILTACGFSQTNQVQGVWELESVQQYDEESDTWNEVDNVVEEWMIVKDGKVTYFDYFEEADGQGFVFPDSYIADVDKIEGEQLVINKTGKEYKKEIEKILEMPAYKTMDVDSYTENQKKVAGYKRTFSIEKDKMTILIEDDYEDLKVKSTFTRLSSDEEKTTEQIMEEIKEEFEKKYNS